MPTITIPDTEELQLGRIGKMRVDWATIPQHVLTHIWKVHSAQFFTDAANSGGKDSTNAARMALAQKKLDACYAGELRARSASAIPTDPFEAECWKTAYQDVLAGLKPYWKDVPKNTRDPGTYVVNRQLAKVGKAPVESINVVIEAYLTKHREAIEKRARETFDARNASDILGLLG